MATVEELQSATDSRERSAAKDARLDFVMEESQQGLTDTLLIDLPVGTGDVAGFIVTVAMEENGRLIERQKTVFVASRLAEKSPAVDWQTWACASERASCEVEDGELIVHLTGGVAR